MCASNKVGLSVLCPQENINQGRYESGSLKKLPLVEYAENSFRPTCDNFSFRVRAYESKSET